MCETMIVVLQRHDIGFVTRVAYYAIILNGCVIYIGLASDSAVLNAIRCRHG